VKLVFTEKAWEDYTFWQQHDPKLVLRINTLLKECLRTPFHGIGKPEPLRGDLKGWWSRRIDQEHRLVYKPSDEGLLIAQCRYHY
jgi:toxin YoeB